MLKTLLIGTFGTLAAVGVQAQLYQATLECHDTAKRFPLAECSTIAECKAYALAYLEEKAEGDYLCKSHAWEVNAGPRAVRGTVVLYPNAVNADGR